MDILEIRKKALDFLRRLDQEAITLDTQRNCSSLLGSLPGISHFAILFYLFNGPAILPHIIPGLNKYFTTSRIVW